MAIERDDRIASYTVVFWLLVTVCVPAAGQTARRSHTIDATGETREATQDDEPDECRVRQVTAFPGSHHFGADFIETIATSPDADEGGPEVLWGLTADLSSDVPLASQAMYISKSVDGGATWDVVARLDSRYFDARIAEGLRNGLAVARGGDEFIITTQRGAFQVLPQPGNTTPVVRPIPGPRVPDTPPKIPITKKPGDPVRANVAALTADGEHMILGYGYFDLDPQMFAYHRGSDGSWVEDGPLPQIPSEMDLLSIDFDEPQNPDPGFLYVGTGDQAYILNLRTKQWARISGVGADSAIHAMSVVGGLHLAACWGIYDPAGPGTVRRVTNARFLLHPHSDEAGSNLRAYGIEVDAAHPARQVVTSITGVYVSADAGESWRRVSELPEGEYRSAHFNADGTVLVSGIPGTFLINPFSGTCSPRLKLHQRQAPHN
jgi:hypothetical protein